MGLEEKIERLEVDIADVKISIKEILVDLKDLMLRAPGENSPLGAKINLLFLFFLKITNRNKGRIVKNGSKKLFKYKIL